MTLVFRTNGPWGAGKGSALTKAEYDGNVWDHEQRLASVESSIPDLNNIDTVTIVGNVLTFTFDDASTRQVTIPAFNFDHRGEWAASTAYFVNDLFTVGGAALYQVLVAHTSGLTFDAAATDGLGHDLYGQWLSALDVTFLTGGSTDYVLQKVDGTDFNFVWVPKGIPRAGAANAFLTKATTGDYDTQWTTLASLTWPFSSITGTIDDTQLITPTVSTLGAIFSNPADVATPYSFISGIEDDGTPSKRQVAFTDLSGLPSLTQRRSAAVNSSLSTTGTVSLDASLSDVFTLVPTGDITLNATNIPAGTVAIRIQTSGTTSWNITFNTNFKSTGVLATGTVSGKTFTILFVGDAVNLCEVARSTAM
jgi:hypothetical protein